MLEQSCTGRYASGMNRKTIRLCWVAAAGFAMAVTGAACAKDQASPAIPHTSQALPGVDGGYRIVRPMPEPENVDPEAGSRFRIGDMDVRIGGSIVVDIGAGDVRRPR